MKSKSQIALKELGLDEYKIQDEPQWFAEEKKNALKKAEELVEGKFLQHIQNAQSISFLEKKDGSIPTFSCASFYETGSNTFMTKLSFFHIPADILVSKLSSFAFLDNLVHESCHQELFNITRQANWNFTEVDHLNFEIPWRNQQWSTTKCLHAYYVYKTLRNFREKYMDYFPEVAEVKEKAIQEARNAELILNNIFSQIKNIIHPHIYHLISQS